MLRRWCGSAHYSTVCRGSTGARGALKRQRAAELVVLELKGEMLGLRVPEPKAPQYAPLEGAAPQ